MGIHLRLFGETYTFARQNCHDLIPVTHWPDVTWMNRSMLPTLPAADLGNVPWPIYGLDYLGDSRTHLCQIAVTDMVEFASVFPRESWDLEE